MSDVATSPDFYVKLKMGAQEVGPCLTWSLEMPFAGPKLNPPPRPAPSSPSP